MPDTLSRLLVRRRSPPWRRRVRRLGRHRGRRLVEREQRRRVRRREDAALARRLLDAAGGLRRGHPGLPEDHAGKDVTFKQSYGASGDQSRAVEAGLPADVVTFSLEPDVDRLVKAGLVAPTGPNTPTKGFVTNSVVAFVVRKGNPKNIKTWDDLLKPGVEVLTPNPFTSRRARSGTCMAALRRQASAPARTRRPAWTTSSQLIKTRPGAGQVRPRGAADLHRGQGRRAALLRERGDHRPAEGPGRRLRRSPTRRS